MEKEKVLCVFKERLAELLEDKQDKDTTLNAKKQAEQMQISYPTFMKYVKEDDRTIPGIDKLEIIANYYNVSADYLLGRTKTKTINEDIQTACKVTGLSEAAVLALQELRRPLDIDEDEKNRILEEYMNFTKEVCQKELGLIPIPHSTGLSDEEFNKYQMIVNKGHTSQILEMLKILLSTNYKDEPQTYAMLLLFKIYEYCKISTDLYGMFKNETCYYPETINAERQKALKMLEINDIIRELDNEIKESEKHGKHIRTQE